MDKPRLYIKKIRGKGRGVFSATPIKKDVLVELCPMIALPGEDFDLVTSTNVVNYCFFLNQEAKKLGVALGFGSLYNHSFQSNAHHIIDREAATISIYAMRDIAAHEEICINYNGEPTNDSDQWFVSRNLKYRP